MQSRTAKLSSKEEIEFDKALIATGANVRRLNVDGCQLEQIHYLRTLGNADAIREGVADAEEVVLIGGSYIGCEVAASLTLLGKHCTIVMQEQATLERGFGAQVGRFFQELLEAHGVTVHGGDELERFEGDGSVAKVVTRGGLELAADAVVIGAGVTPTCSSRSARVSRSASAAACAAHRVWRARLRACSPRATSANTSRSCTAARRCGSSTGTSPSTTARPPR